MVVARGGIHKFCQETGEDYAAIYKYIHKAIKMGNKAARRLERVMGVPQNHFDRNIAREQVAHIPIIPNTLEPKKH